MAVTMEPLRTLWRLHCIEDHTMFAGQAIGLSCFYC